MAFDAYYPTLSELLVLNKKEYVDYNIDMIHYAQHISIKPYVDCFYQGLTPEILLNKSTGKVVCVYIRIQDMTTLGFSKNLDNILITRICNFLEKQGFNIKNWSFDPHNKDYSQHIVKLHGESVRADCMLLF